MNHESKFYEAGKLQSLFIVMQRKISISISFKNVSVFLQKRKVALFGMTSGQVNDNRIVCVFNYIVHMQ